VLFPFCGSPCPSLVNYSSFFQHLINFFAILGDFVLCRYAINPEHFHYVLAWPTLYATFHLFYTLATDSGGHRPVYFFLDASSPLQPAWIIGVMLITIGAFFAIWGVSRFCFQRRVEKTEQRPSEGPEIHQYSTPSTPKKIAEVHDNLVNV
jgi:hypothetical protein